MSRLYSAQQKLTGIFHLNKHKHFKYFLKQLMKKPKQKNSSFIMALHTQI